MPKLFELGGPGGPGRPEGSRNRASVLLDEIASGKAKEIAQKVVKAALNGDMRAAELVLSRIWPPRKLRAVSLKLPPIMTAADSVTAMRAIVGAASAGEIGLEEAQVIASLLEMHRRGIELFALEERIAKLEAATN